MGTVLGGMLPLEEGPAATIFRLVSPSCSSGLRSEGGSVGSAAVRFCCDALLAAWGLLEPVVVLRVLVRSNRGAAGAGADEVGAFSLSLCLSLWSGVGAAGGG